MTASPLPTVILPGYLAGAADYLPLARELQTLGIQAEVVPLRWYDWLPTVGGRSVAPILDALEATIRNVQTRYGNHKVNLVAHSAGGWIGRIFLGDRPYYGRVWDGRSRVAQLIALGTPHTSLEPWTQRNLDFVNQTYPGAYYPDVRYVCVAGQSVFGDRTWARWVAYNSYRLTCGQGETWGDGITPIAAAHLEGAENLILAGANHSPRNGLWYGSPSVVPLWAKYLLETPST